MITQSDFEPRTTPEQQQFADWICNLSVPLGQPVSTKDYIRVPTVTNSDSVAISIRRNAVRVYLNEELYQKWKQAGLEPKPTNTMPDWYELKLADRALMESNSELMRETLQYSVEKRDSK
jgi:hypothetical protein